MQQKGIKKPYLVENVKTFILNLNIKYLRKKGK